MGILVLFFVMFVCGFCNGSVYKVGDSTGWAIIGNIDYTKWASSKSFQVGDTFLFQYNPSYHNVLEVSRSDFHTCDATAPIATFATGNDTIVIRSPGHYYYICGFMGHCQAGQKVDIRVPKPDRPDGSPISTPLEPHNSSGSSDGPLAPGPSLSNGHFHSGLLSFTFGLLLIFVWAF
ncbi:mavicyanin-like [Salvia miltiorrhiza]|uniref:mavicyanin-like n=1 Tax=Salvia miltiorrhiza TaxID=226208 RepID=UPI0025AC5B53|nr:mavicyanin-like [Salvia miltiorrhiza]